MLKQTITYTDFDDVEQSETVYFHMSKAELIKLEARSSKIHGEEVTGGFREKLQTIIDSGDGGKIMDAFDEIVDMSYGVRSEDGKRFVKSKELTTEFKQSAAYDEFFTNLVTDAEVASKFVNGIVPKDIAQAMAEQDKPSGPPVVRTDEAPVEVQEEPRIEKEEDMILDLTPEEIADLMKRRKSQ